MTPYGRKVRSPNAFPAGRFAPCLAFSLFLTLFAVSCAQGDREPRLADDPGAARWVHKTLSRMTIEEKVGQMLVARYTGNFFNEDNETLKDLESLIQKRKLGGLILFLGEVYETAHLTNRLQALSGLPLLIASDLERGAGNQVAGATLFPPLMAIGAAGSETLAYEMGKITAFEGRSMGIHMTYAPVVDVNVNPDNPIINTRSAGEDPEEVGRLAAAFIRGCQENGMMATAKHFPGHGDTAQDSHTLLPSIDAGRERLDAVELYPFRKAIEAGVSAVMIAHLQVPSLDPTPGLPSSLSAPIITGLLREDMGFRGLVVTDALEMGGVTGSFTAEQAAVRCVQAGVDILLLPVDLEAASDALIKAVKNGEIPLSRINASVRRILEAKARLGLHKNRFVDIPALSKKIGSGQALSRAAEAFESAITLVKNEGDIVPLSAAGKRLAVLSLSSDAADYYVGRPFITEVLKRAPGSLTAYADLKTGQEFLEEAKLQAGLADAVIIALFSTVSANKGNVGIEPRHLRLVEYVAATGKPLVVVSFGSPYFLREFPEVGAYLCAYRSAAGAQEAAAKALFGEIEIRGKLPVSIPGLFPLGHGLVLPRK